MSFILGHAFGVNEILLPSLHRLENHEGLRLSDELPADGAKRIGL
jgi:hypothetical protein